MDVRSRPSVDPLVVLAIVAIVPALALFGVWRWAAGQTTTAEPPPEIVATPAPTPSAALTTPLLSFRRLPGLLSRDLNITTFTNDVDEFATRLNDTSCVAVSVDGQPVGRANADVPLIPASNQKLLTAAVALEVLGEDHVFTTELRSTAAPTGGAVADLYLVGGGDPLLTSSTYPVQNDPNPVTSPTSLDALADAVVAAGITRVDGQVLGDGSRYDDEYYAPSWSPDIHGIEAGPYDALLVNDARVTGDDLRADDPNEAAARELVQLLQARGVTVTGGPGSGATPADSVVVGSVTSAPLTAVVGEMLSASDNNTAEMLVKELGVTTASGGGATRQAGLDAMRQTLEGWGVAGLELADGSGLSNDNRVSCNGLAAVLTQHTPTDAMGAGLAVAGETGTLADIFTESPVAGRLLGKSGTLGNPPFNADPPAVKSLSGYLPIEGGGAVEFALILNGDGPLADQSVYRPIWDGLAATLAGYPSGATPADLQPR